MQTNHLLLKGGGRITAIHAVAHSTYKGVAQWYFLGNIAWSAEENNGKPVERDGLEITPNRICYDSEHEEQGKAEIASIMHELNEYLATKGKWLKKPKWVGECLVNWVPKEKTGLVPL